MWRRPMVCTISVAEGCRLMGIARGTGPNPPFDRKRFERFTADNRRY